MFGNKDYITEEQVAELVKPLSERLERLAELVDRQSAALLQLSDTVDALRNKLDGQPVVSQTDDSCSIDTGLAEDGGAQKETGTFSARYFSMPSPDGVFTESTDQEVVGKSIYLMHTEDGTNGHFVMLSTSDAIATAMISVSQFVKPVCRIEGNTHRMPQFIMTLKEGVVQRQGDIWKVVKKATVQFL